jgi:hypothetical protein
MESEIFCCYEAAASSNPRFYEQAARSLEGVDLSTASFASSVY